MEGKEAIVGRIISDAEARAAQAKQEAAARADAMMEEAAARARTLLEEGAAALEKEAAEPVLNKPIAEPTPHSAAQSARPM